MIFALSLLVWTRRLPETLEPANRRDLRFSSLVEAGRIVLTNRSTMAYTVVLTLLFGVFTSYLASSESIVGGIIARPELFPLVFGGLAAVMGSAFGFAMAGSLALAITLWAVPAGSRNASTHAVS